MPRLFALVDCANFYVSCERVLDPSLARVPVAVLSNNDGCIIARTAEVMALDIPMGAPYFKIRDQLDAAGVHVFSANFPLYADLSCRVMDTMRTLCPHVEVYSIDEAFLGLGLLTIPEAEALGEALHDRVGQWTGLPVRVGIGPTKTLAKIASELAKQTGQRVFALDLDATDTTDALLEQVPVGEVWGVGRRLLPRLLWRGVSTARHLRLRRSPSRGTRWAERRSEPYASPSPWCWCSTTSTRCPRTAT